MKLETASKRDGVPDTTAVIDRASEYERQISELQDQKMRLYERYVLGTLDANGYKQDKAALDELILKTKTPMTL